MIKSRVLTRLFVVSPSKCIIRLLLNLQCKKKSRPRRSGSSHNKTAVTIHTLSNSHSLIIFLLHHFDDHASYQLAHIRHLHYELHPHLVAKSLQQNNHQLCRIQ